MAFVSDAQRRWWFANHGSNSGSGGDGGGGAGDGSGGGGSGGSDAVSTVQTNVAPIDPDAGYRAYMASPERLAERREYAQAMYPELSEADALRRLNDRNG